MEKKVILHAFMIRQFKMLAARFIVRAVPGKKGVGMGVGLERNMKMGYHQHKFIFFMVQYIWIFQVTPHPHNLN